MNEELIKQLAAAIEKADQSDLMDGGRYFVEHLTDLTRCRHGETGEYLREADGQLVELLWNNRHTFLNTLRHVAPLVEAARAYQNAVRVYTMPIAGYMGMTDEPARNLREALAPFQQEAK